VLVKGDNPLIENTNTPNPIEKETKMDKGTIYLSLRDLAGEIVEDYADEGYEVLDIDDYLRSDQWDEFEDKLCDEFFSAERRAREARPETDGITLSDLAWSGCRGSFRERIMEHMRSYDPYLASVIIERRRGGRS